jgi:hypothetical protein
MDTELRQISRHELYKQVWNVPMTKLAAQYGLSDVGLAKICKKYNIPRPPRGYWAKKAAGQKVEKDPLPNRNSNELIEIRSIPSTDQNSELPDKLSRQIQYANNHRPIVVPKALHNPHPLVKQSAEILEICQPNHVGILEPKSNSCLDIRVSKNSLRRALRIMHALIMALFERGFEVYLVKGETKAKVLEEDLRFGISEELATKKVEPKNHDLDGYYRFGHSRFDSIRVPSGKLCLSIHDVGYWWGDKARKNWRDTKRKTLENSLDNFVKGLIKLAVQKKEYERKEAEQEQLRLEMQRQAEEMERQRAELERMIQEEKQRVSQLITDAENRHKSKMIRNFISEVEKEYSDGKCIYEPASDFEAWIKWARNQADRLDPLTASPPSIIDEEAKLNSDKSPKIRYSDSLYNGFWNRDE